MENEHKPDYEKLYFTLAARVADAIDMLIAAARECEEMYVQTRSAGGNNTKSSE